MISKSFVLTYAFINCSRTFNLLLSSMNTKENKRIKFMVTGKNATTLIPRLKGKINIHYFSAKLLCLESCLNHFLTNKNVEFYLLHSTKIDIKKSAEN